MEAELDLVVIGSGPAGQKAAIQAAKLRKRVAVVERAESVGGVCVNTGTIPSKTIREAILYLTGLDQRGIYGQGYRVRDRIEAGDLRERMGQVVERERNVVRDQLLRNHVQLVPGTARLLDGRTVEVVDAVGGERRLVAGAIVIATGSVPARVPGIAFNERTIFDSDTILQMERIPDSIVVVGAGVVGIEYASMFAALGSRVTVVDARVGLLDFCDPEIVEALRYHLRDLNVIFRFSETVTKVADLGDGAGTVTHLESGKQIAADAVLYSAGRVGATADLGLDALGIEVDGRGRIRVGEHYQTAVGGVYAVGDVIGFPSLASTSAEQGRLAAAHVFGLEADPMDELLPIGVYAIPEISFVGKTEPDLTEASIPYEVGIAHYRELARGQINGETYGLLKLLVSPADRTLLGVHVFGAEATEVVHIGQAVMGLGGTIDYLVETVFNYPTLAEAYKVAALDAANKLRAVSVAVEKGGLNMGYATSALDALGDGPFRKAREPLRVTAFGVNGLVLPPGTEWFDHFHQRQDELYFVHRGRAAFSVAGETFELGPGGLCHVESTTPRKVWNAGEEELVLLIVGGEGGYVGRDGQLVNPEDAERRAAAGKGDLSAISRGGSGQAR